MGPWLSVSQSTTWLGAPTAQVKIDSIIVLLGIRYTHSLSLDKQEVSFPRNLDCPAGSTLPWNCPWPCSRLCSGLGAPGGEDAAVLGPGPAGHPRRQGTDRSTASEDGGGAWRERDPPHWAHLPRGQSGSLGVCGHQSTHSAHP